MTKKFHLFIKIASYFLIFILLLILLILIFRRNSKILQYSVTNVISRTTSVVNASFKNQTGVSKTKMYYWPVYGVSSYGGACTSVKYGEVWSSSSNALNNNFQLGNRWIGNREYK